MAYYTVDLYDVRYDEDYRGQAIWVDEVIVKKGFRSATELLTGQKIEILPQKAFINKYEVVAEKYHDKESFAQTGYHLIIKEKDLKPENLTTVEDIDRYVDTFDGCRYQKIYEEIKSRTKSDTNQNTYSVYQKAKMVSETRK